MHKLSDYRKSNIKEEILEVIFLIGMFVVLWQYYRYSYISHLIVSLIIIIVLLNLLSDNESMNIPSKRKAIFPFIYIYILIFFQSTLYLKLMTLPKIVSIQSSIIRLIIIQIIVIILPMLTCYFFSIKLTDFNWKTSFKWLVVSCVIFIILFIPKIYIDGFSVFKYNKFSCISDYIFDSFDALIFNASFEEVLFRGFLISLLKSFKLNNTKINIIQSIIFGLIHIYQTSFWGLSYHIIMGYVLGKLYLKSKSLTPSIILHLLINQV